MNLKLRKFTGSIADSEKFLLLDISVAVNKRLHCPAGELNNTKPWELVYCCYLFIHQIYNTVMIYDSDVHLPSLKKQQEVLAVSRDRKIQK